VQARTITLKLRYADFDTLTRSRTVSPSASERERLRVSRLHGGLRPHIAMCRLMRMPTNLAIDDQLLAEAQQAGGHRTKKDTVNEALREYILRRRQAKLVKLFGKIDFDSSYDHKKQRRRT
jgi:Arc/MetJ family transcription regulator